MKKNLLVALLFILAMTTVLSGCFGGSSGVATTSGGANDSQEAGAKGEEKAASKESYTIGISLPAADHGWMGALIQNAQAEAEKHSNIDYILYTAKDPAKQTSDIEDLITKQVDAIVMLPMESAAMTPAAEKVADANIPLIVVDRGVNTEKYKTYVGGDNYGIGFVDAKYLVEELIKRKGEPKGKVIEISGIPSTVTDLRTQGFRDYIKDYPEIEIVATQPGDFTREKALKATENILQAHKEIDAVYSQDDDMTIGIVQAIRDAKREDEMFIVSSGGMKEIYKMMKDREKPEIIVSVTYAPTMGGTGVFLAKQILEGNGLDGFWEKGVPHHIILEATPVTPDNVDEFYNPDANY